MFWLNAHALIMVVHLAKNGIWLWQCQHSKLEIGLKIACRLRNLDYHKYNRSTEITKYTKDLVSLIPENLKIQFICFKATKLLDICFK